MMTKLKLNVYRAEDEFICLQKLQWRREEEEGRKERKKVASASVPASASASVPASASAPAFLLWHLFVLLILEEKKNYPGREGDGCTSYPAEQGVEGEEGGGKEGRGEG